ncbi:hypothetical protein AJ80_02645 [Polytolypa hystricis UAMH7299]|uniref:Vta1 C-terminal domain-containing protein n=1 Tax=Polytolypa hystricis (strain UAMH7299) TaxID=1447883 RepID=A0A2B7YQB8_POLH7|nr:hypothetical protein AJ80_02645 [Polytolypa hystricis UAMH7299]
MAANIPAELKTADISRFAHRASQLEKAKPIITYWCNYWIANQILSKGLHSSDDECMKYTTDLMDKLEKFKSENADNDAVTDDVAGQAYVEQFALETFQRADNAVLSNKASLQTADTFQAAATFMELCQVWGPIDPELAAKVKFAKYHALRIAKAVKAGEDPNLSNPRVEETQGAEDELELDPNDPEVKALHNPSSSESRPEPKPRQPSVEEVPDDFDRVQRRLAGQSSLDESLHPSRSSSAAPQPQQGGNSPPTAMPSEGLPNPPVFQGRTIDADSHRNQRPSHMAQSTFLDLPAAPSDFPPGTPVSTPPVVPTQTHLGAAPDSFPSLNTFQSFPPPSMPSGTDQQEPQPPVTSQPQVRPAAPTTPSILAQSSRPTAPDLAYPRSTPHQTVDEDSIGQAQKHARWAVSALNFDDVDTAIKELRNALNSLGAQ